MKVSIATLLCSAQNMLTSSLSHFRSKFSTAAPTKKKVLDIYTPGTAPRGRASWRPSREARRHRPRPPRTRSPRPPTCHPAPSSARRGTRACWRPGPLPFHPRSVHGMVHPGRRSRGGLRQTVSVLPTRNPEEPFLILIICYWLSFSSCSLLSCSVIS